MNNKNQEDALLKIEKRLSELEKKMKLYEDNMVKAQKLIKEQRVHITHLRKGAKIPKP